MLGRARAHTHTHTRKHSTYIILNDFLEFPRSILTPLPTKTDLVIDNRSTSLTCRLLSKVVNLDLLIARFVSLWVFRLTYFICGVRLDEQARVFGETT